MIAFPRDDGVAPIGDIACAEITDADQSRPPPSSQSIDRDAEEADVVLAFQFADAIGPKGRHFDDALTEGFEVLRLHALDPTLRNDIGALPVVAAIEHDHEPARFDMAEGVCAVAAVRDMRNQSTRAILTRSAAHCARMMAAPTAVHPRPRVPPAKRRPRIPSAPPGSPRARGWVPSSRSPSKFYWVSGSQSGGTRRRRPNAYSDPGVRA
jgi:hypothetical protein